MRTSLALRTAFVVAAITSAAAIGKAIYTSVKSPAPREASIPPIRSGNHLVAVLIISESCSAASRDDFREALHAALEQLETTAKQHDQFLTTIAVGVSENSATSRRFLSELGNWDQVIVGGGWLNTGVIQYVWRDFAGTTVVPQLLLLRRHVEVSQSAVAVTEDELLFRLSGADDIIRWVRAGGPVYDRGSLAVAEP